MKNRNYIKILEKKDRVIMFNRTNSNCIKIHKEVYNLIKNINEVDELYNIASEYENEDKDFFISLANTLKEKHILDDCNASGIQKVDFVITDFCNLNCSHCCHSSFYLDLEKVKGQAIFANMDVLKAIVNINPKQIVITGGEPLLLNNFEEVVNYLKNNYNGSTSLSTNSTLINKDNVKMICGCFKQVDISIDGIDEEKCDKIRGKGTFKKVLNSIKLLKDNGAKSIVLSIALDNETVNDREIFEQMCSDLGVKPLVRIMNLIGRAKGNHIDSDKIINFMEASDSNLAKCYDCAGGVNELSVNYKGDIFPCNLFMEDEYKIANILEGNYLDKLEWNKKHKWFKAFSQYIPDFREECEECEINTFCWDCPSLAKTYLDNHNLDSFKKICSFKRNQIMEILWHE